MRGGKRTGAGRRDGSTTTDNVKMGISISRDNAEWLREQKKHGKNISRMIDLAVSAWRNMES